MEVDSEENKKQLHYLVCDFKYFFCGNVDISIYLGVLSKLSLYIDQGSQEALDSFVQEYYKMKTNIIHSHDELVDYMNSKDYQDEILVSKLKIKMQFRKVQKLCDSLDEFEYLFYKKTSISLESVENKFEAAEQCHAM